MLYIYKDRRLIFLCMLFFFIQINPNENESSCLISEWNFFVKGWYFATIWLNFNLLSDRMLFIWSQIPFKCVHGLWNTYF